MDAENVRECNRTWSLCRLPTKARIHHGAHGCNHHELASFHCSAPLVASGSLRFRSISLATSRTLLAFPFLSSTSLFRRAGEAPLTFVNLNCFSLMNARSNRRNQTIRDRRLMGVNSKMNLKGLSLRGRGVDPPPLNALPPSPPPPQRSGMKCNRERILLMEITRVVGTEGLDSWFISPLSIHDL